MKSGPSQRSAGRSLVVALSLAVAGLLRTGSAGGAPVERGAPSRSGERARPAVGGSRLAPPRAPRRPLVPRRASIAPVRPLATHAIEGRAPTSVDVARLMKRIVASERNFYRPGVAYDGETGLTYDGHQVAIVGGRPLAQPRTWSAASKESLHIILLVKAIEGDATARALLTPDPDHPEAAVDAAVDVLARKLVSYRRFDREFPGFGGFLPWFKVGRGRMVPTGHDVDDISRGTDGDWTYRVPALDNGQLAWSLYYASKALARVGRADLSRACDRQLAQMTANVVRIFYDPAAGQLRAEARLDRGSQVAPQDNRYSSNQPWMLGDAYEGLMMVHFADLFGRWSGAEAGREALWASPRREPFRSLRSGRPITTVKDWAFSSHEDWGFLILPTRDLPIADRLFLNGQRDRTQHAATRAHSGLYASTHVPVRESRFDLAYLSAAGRQDESPAAAARGAIIHAPYAAFPLALVDRRLFAGWLESMVRQSGGLGELGIGESYSDDGRVAPVATWDGKALPLVAYMGGIVDDVRRALIADGKYAAFMKRVAGDYRRFDGVAIEGEEVPFAAPPRARVRERAQRRARHEAERARARERQVEP